MPLSLAEHPDKPKPVVLFVDDNLDVLEVYEAYFGHNGYVVLTSSRAANAIKLAEANALNVAVVDYEMPEMNGHQAALALKSICPALPVILVSGSNDIPLETLQLVDSFVPKSFGPRHLHEIIEKLIHD